MPSSADSPASTEARAARRPAGYYEIHPDGLPTPRRWWSAAAIWLAIFMTVLDSAIANVALPTIAREFGAAPSESIWIVNAYQLAIVTTLLPLASLGEIVGFRRVYRAGLGLFIVASLACALSRSLEMLTIARTLQGLGAAGVMSVNGALVRHTYPHTRLGFGIGMNALMVSASSAIGPTIAAGILAIGPWQWLFGVTVPIGLAALGLGWMTLPMNTLSERRFDWISAAMNALTFGLVITGTDVVSRTRAWLIGTLELVSGLIVGALLVLREVGRHRPLVPFDLLRKPLFTLSVATSIASFTAQMLAFVALPFHFENVMHYDQVATGLLLSPWPVAVGVMAPIAGWLADRVSTAVLCAAGLAIFAAGLAALALMSVAAPPLDVAWRMAVCGAGFGVFQSPNNRMMLTAAPRERAGAAGGMLGTARLTGQSFGAVMTAIFLHFFGDAGEVVGLFVAAGFALLAAGVSLTRTAVRAQA